MSNVFLKPHVLSFNFTSKLAVNGEFTIKHFYRVDLSACHAIPVNHPASVCFSANDSQEFIRTSWVLFSE